MERWNGKIAVVTGASSGIGASIASNLAQRGVIVVGLARRIDRLQDLTKTAKGTIHPVQCDIQKESDIIKAFDWVEKKLGGVDILVNNAAVAPMPALMSGKSEEWRSILETNILGLSICTREALKTMRNRGDNGHIFHINSVAGHHVPAFPTLHLGMYSASKFAVTSLTESLRMELLFQKSNIRITSISPGAVNTDMALNIFASGGAIEAIPDGLRDYEFMESQDVTDALLYALSARPCVQVHEIMLQPIGTKYS